MFYYPLCCLSHFPINWQLTKHQSLSLLLMSVFFGLLLHSFTPIAAKSAVQTFSLPSSNQKYCMSKCIYIIMQYCILEAHFHKSRLISLTMPSWHLDSVVKQKKSLGMAQNESCCRFYQFGWNFLTRPTFVNNLFLITSPHTTFPSCIDNYCN